MARFTAGIFQSDITPPKGVKLAGYPHFPRENTGAHDPLFATAVYLCDGICELAIVTLDILFFSKKYTAKVRRRVNKLCGLPEHNLLICCSHTHSGPWAAGNPELEAATGRDEYIDGDYLKSLLDTITDAVIKAKSSAFPAEVGLGLGLCGAERGVGGNRRVRGGIADPSVNVLAVRDMSGSLRAAIVNYALHPTFLHEDSSLVSSDYPCYVRFELARLFPGAVIGFAQGTSGDQSSRYFRRGQSYDEAERVGRELGAAASDVIKSMKFNREPVLKCAWSEIPLQLRVYAPIPELEEKVRLRTAEYMRLKTENASYLEVQNANLRMLGAEDMLGYAICIRDGIKIELRDDENPAEIAAYRIGDSIITGIPGEVFVEYGLKIKAGSPVRTFVFELANGCLPGYCINADAIAEEGYEAGNSMLAPGFGDRIADTALELISEIL
jgi:Neutral/alkaline non-lysosomal ceramidase.